MTMTTALKHQPSDLVNGKWIPLNGDEMVSSSPSDPTQIVWRGSPVPDHAQAAINAARAALPDWSAWSIDRRIEVLKRVKAIANDRAEALADLLCHETGKARWECLGEAKLIAGKVDITLEEGQNSGRQRVNGFDFKMGDTKAASCWFRPHGVMTVIGPFNFPAHLPNGHIIPALLMGNTIVFKPSEKTPAVGQFIAEIYAEALDALDAPPGVFNLVQGAVQTSKALTTHPDADGILFTGSWQVGRAILEANLDHPGKMIALEMGGNNAAVIMDDADLHQAVAECVRCAFITTGQRCTCTRRLIVHEAVADRVISALIKSARSLVVDTPTAETVFMGPIISQAARQEVFDFQARMQITGGEVLLESAPVEGKDGWYLTPSIIRVPGFSTTRADCECDEEVFGPLLRVCTVNSLDEAIEQANATKYGLAASIFTANPDSAARFRREARAGCVNINCGTAGASSKLPFGGLGLSGNHRPAGAFSLDYCGYPVAGMTESSGNALVPQGMTIDSDWLI